MSKIVEDLRSIANTGLRKSPRLVAVKAIDHIPALTEELNKQDDAFERMAALRDAAVARAEAAELARDQANREAAELREALTPSAETKAVYMGEFQFRMGDHPSINVPWITIKQIMQAILARADLNPNPEGQH